VSNFDTPPHRLPEPPPPGQRSGCATAFMITVGIILLLPGILCAMLGGGGQNNPITGLVMLIALGGVALIVWAFVRK
jgi:hypothetical protein